MRTIRLLFVAMAVLSLSLASRVRAEAVWAIAGRQVLRLYATVGGLTPEKRVEMMDARVTEMLSKGDGTLSASDINVKDVGGVFAIIVRGDTLVTATAKDAEAHHTSSEKLARTWLTAVRNTLPQLAPRVNKRGA